jgi:hypothetical protein
MNAAEDDDGVRAAMAGELRLLDRSVRVRPELVRELLHPDFVEFGASGRHWDAASILEVTGTDDPDLPSIEATELAGVRLAPDVVHLTYVSADRGRRARRSSIWRRTDDGWRVWFHQGTLIG